MEEQIFPPVPRVSQADVVVDVLPEDLGRRARRSSNGEVLGLAGRADVAHKSLLVDGEHRRPVSDPGPGAVHGTSCCWLRSLTG